MRVGKKCFELCISIPRLPESTRNRPDFKKRIWWHLITILTIVFVVVLGYAVFTTAFIKIPQDYQWILALLSPFFRDYVFKILNYVVAKAAGVEGQGENMKKFIPLHYIVTKHAVFLSIIVGGVATPMSSLCIMITDFAKTVYSGGKIIYRMKVKNETKANVEGNF